MERSINSTLQDVSQRTDYINSIRLLPATLRQQEVKMQSFQGEKDLYRPQRQMTLEQCCADPGNCKIRYLEGC